MTTEISQKLYTVEEFLNLEWPDEDDDEYELLEGRIMAKPKGGTSGEHGEIVATLVHWLKTFADINTGQYKLGRIYSGASCNLGQSAGSNYLEPDVCFVLNGRTPSKFSGPIPVAPDLVIEVNSPSDTTEKIHNKLEAYRKAGVRLIWSIYMLEKFVIVYHFNDPDIKLLTLYHELEGADLLPGFRLKVNALFE